MQTFNSIVKRIRVSLTFLSFNGIIVAIKGLYKGGTMDTIHISQFYSCSEISLSSELFYISELGKYLMLKHKKVLSLDGVILNSVLKKSIIWDYFRVAVARGYIVDTNLPSYETDITIQYPVDYTTRDMKNFLFQLDECHYDAVESSKRSNSVEYNYCTPKETQVCFTKMTSEQWVWTIKGICARDEMINSASLNTSCASKAWLSLVAMVAVERLITGSPKLLGFLFPYVIVKNQLALSDFMLLMDETNALSGWVKFAFDDNVSEDMQRQVGYEAWWYKGKEKGYLANWYKPKDKLTYMKNNLKIDTGDIVLLYERNYSTKFNYVKSIASCHVAIVRYISSTSVGLEVVNTVRTRHGSEIAYQNYTMAVKKMYCCSTKYKEWNASKKTFDISDLGIEYMMYTEGHFIVPLGQADDIVVLDVSDGDKRSAKYCLHQNDAIYWILKDYNIEFNEEKFLHTYFPNSTPAYTVYMSGQDLPDEYLAE